MNTQSSAQPGSHWFTVVVAASVENSADITCPMMGAFWETINCQFKNILKGMLYNSILFEGSETSFEVQDLPSPSGYLRVSKST